MTIEERKIKNAELYPASVLDWLNEITDEIYADFESRICSNCIYFDKYKCMDANCYIGYCFSAFNDIHDISDSSFGCNKFSQK